MEHKLVLVVWRDAWGDDAHLEEDALCHIAPVVRENVGFLYENNSDRVVISKGRWANPFHNKVFIAGFDIFPTEMVKDIIELNKGKRIKVGHD